MNSEPLIGNISDTARWVAVFRARENERPNPLFRDPYARQLAGTRGEQIAANLGYARTHEWAYITRTYLFNQYIERAVNAGADAVVNLACGLDTRPYTMQLPSSLKWVEVDLPGILDYKEEILRNEKPRCSLERVRLDLSNLAGRRALFTRIGQQSKNVLIISEGLITYLSAEEVASLGTDLAAQATFRNWATDLCSPGLLKRLQRGVGTQLEAAGAPLKFGPPEGPDFFVRCGWKVSEVHSMLHTAARLKRLPWFMRLFALFPEQNGAQGPRPWSGALLLER